MWWLRFTYDPAGNNPPTVSLTGPADGATYPGPAAITLSATAADSNGTVTKVEFYNGTTLLGTDFSAPYTISWASVPAGTYTLSAKAYDDAAAVTTSNAVAITVTPAPPGLGLKKFTEPMVGYPNPVSGNLLNVALNLDADAERITVQAYNSAMQLAYEGEWKDVTLSDGGVKISGLQGWAPGIYLLKARAILVDGKVQDFPVLKVVVK